jgi:predicted outer membrane repeat protein
MKMNTKFFALLFVIFFVSISLVSASDNNNQTLMINNNEDMGLSVDAAQDYDLSVDESTPDNYTAGAGTFTELQSLIWGSTAGDTLVLDKDYELDSELVRQHIIIDRTLTIDGNGHTLDGKNTKRIFYIEPQATNTVLKNINFVNGYHAEAGAAIFWRSDDGTLESCTFSNNIVNKNGGAVYWSGTNGTATNNIFTNNKAGVTKLSTYQSAGAIYWEGNDGKASYNQFIDNFALTNGGAITWKGENGILTKNAFTNNLGKESGGAVYWDGDNGLIQDNNFTSSTAELSGGAIYYEADNGVVKNNNFIKNIAKTNAGAIRWNGNGGTVTNNYFESNDATLTGGAIYWEGTNGILSNNQFVKNNANVSAGAILWNGNFGTLENDIFTDNTASTYGGAIYFKGNHSNLNNNQFKNNKASKSGGTLYWEGIYGKLTSNTFEKSSSSSGSGGAIRWDADNGVLTNNTFQESSANSGGAIYWEGLNGKLTENTFIKSTSQSAGGAIYWNSNNAIISKNKFEDSASTSNYGGAIYLNAVGSTINDNKFINNKASKSGGAVYISGESNTVDNNLFNNNIAQSGSGGAVSWNGNKATLTKNTFEGNSAPKGTGVYGEGNNARITENIFINSIENDGTLRWEGSNNDISNNIYISNSRTPKLSLNDVSIYYGKTSKLTATLTDSRSNALIGKDVTLNVNGNTITGKTNSLGQTSIEIKDFELGSFKATATFAGDNDYDAADATSTVTVKTTIESSDLVAKYNNAVFNATFLDSNGNKLSKGSYVSFTVDNDAYRVQVGDNGVASLTIDKDPGEYNIGIVNIETGEYKSNTVKINEAQTTINLTGATNATVGDKTTLVAIVDANTGYVTFKVNNNITDVNLTNGKATLELGVLAEGKYTVTATYTDPDNHYLSSTTTANFAITKKSAQLNVKVDDIAEGEDAIFDISTVAQAEGVITLTINNENYNETLVNGKAKITISNLTSNQYPYTVKYDGNDIYAADTKTGTLNVKSDNVIITAPDVTKYFKGDERLTVTLTDKAGAPLKGKVVSITINGVTYNRTTDDKGIASMALGLPSNTYTANITFRGDEDYKAANTTCNVVIKATVSGKDITKIEKAKVPYRATFLDSTGKPLAKGTEIKFNINGVFYKRVIGDNGEGQLNINLAAGKYTITAVNTQTGENAANTVIIKPRIVNNTDVTKFFRNDTQYYVTVLDDNGNPAKAGENVIFNINGVLYTRQTNENGIARMNINLPPGKYTITAEYKNCRASNKINVLPILTAKDITMKYRDGTKFEAKLVNGSGSPYANQTISFNINGVFYTRLTDEDGIAKLNINLMAGEYIITSTYNGLNIANKVTITS